MRKLPSLSRTCVSIGLGCLLTCPRPAHAQTFVEFAGGWNWPAPAPAGDNYTRGLSIRASVGRQIAPSFRWRIDALVSEFDHNVQFYPPCAFPGCIHPYYNTRSVSVAGLAANAMMNLDSRGIFYVIGGAGLYDLHEIATELHLGASAGAGVAVPVGSRLRVTVEARCHGLLGATVGPPWLVPVTVGLRY
jgi:hypothetical protein